MLPPLELGYLFYEPLVPFGIIAVAAVAAVVFTLLYKTKVLTGSRVFLLASILSVAGIPLGLYLFTQAYTVIGPSMLFGSIAVLCGSIVSLLISHGRRRAPSRVAPPPAPTPVGAEKPSPIIEKVDEDYVRLKVERTATESALKSLESAIKEQAINKETFDKYKATYSDRLRKIDSELSKKGTTGIAKLEGEIDKVRQTYLDKLKDLSKKVISVRPIATAPPREIVEPPKVTAQPVARTPSKLPEIPSVPRRESMEEEATMKEPLRVPVAPPTKAPEVSAAPKMTPTGPTTIADLRREMMDELNRLKRLIGRAGA